MGEPQPTVFSALRANLGAATDARPWIPIASSGAGVAASALFFELADWWYLAGVAVLVLGFIPELAASWWRKKEETDNKNATARQILLTNDALIPLSQEITKLVSARLAPQRQQAMAGVLEKAVGTAYLHFKAKEHVRACIFLLSDDLKSMEPKADVGRKDRPAPFIRGTARGDAAFEVLAGGRAVHVRDLGSEEPEQWAGTGEQYQTFITCPIVDHTGAYGLLTVDAPQPGTFSESDEHLVELTATLVAIACAHAISGSVVGQQ